MNPVIEAIDQGHFQKTVDGKILCRACLDEMPCATIKEARQKQRREYGQLKAAKPPKVA